MYGESVLQQVSLTYILLDVEQCEEFNGHSVKYAEVINSSCSANSAETDYRPI